MQQQVKQEPQLQEGELYIVTNGELRHIERTTGDLPKVPISQLAHDRLLDLRRRCRKTLGGFRPDVALVASALLEHSASESSAEAIVAAYHATTVARASSLARSG